MKMKSTKRLVIAVLVLSGMLLSAAPADAESLYITRYYDQGYIGLTRNADGNVIGDWMDEVVSFLYDGSMMHMGWIATTDPAKDLGQEIGVSYIDSHGESPYWLTDLPPVQKLVFAVYDKVIYINQDQGSIGAPLVNMVLTRLRGDLTYWGVEYAVDGVDFAVLRHDNVPPPVEDTEIDLSPAFTANTEYKIVVKVITANGPEYPNEVILFFLRVKYTASHKWRTFHTRSADGYTIWWYPQPGAASYRVYTGATLSELQSEYDSGNYTETEETFACLPVENSTPGLHYLVSKVSAAGVETPYDWVGLPLDQGRDFILVYNLVDGNGDYTEEIVAASDLNYFLQFYRDSANQVPGSIPLMFPQTCGDKNVLGFYPSALQKCDLDGSGALEYAADLIPLYQRVLNPDLNHLQE